MNEPVQYTRNGYPTDEYTRLMDEIDVMHGWIWMEERIGMDEWIGMDMNDCM